MNLNPKEGSGRSRGPNFNNAEKVHLLNLIANKYARVLEDKKTDRASNWEKEKAWQSIEKEFNASSTTNIYRKATSLKKCYENRKKEIKRTLADERKERMLTGGGPPPKIKKNDTDELLISILNKKTLSGLENPFDDDADTSKVVVDPEDEESILVNELIRDTEDEMQQSLIPNREETTSPAPMSAPVNWKKYTPVKLQKCASSSLRIESPPKLSPNKEAVAKTNQVTPITNNTHTSRRRPTTIVKALTSSDIAKKYDVLLDKRQQILDCQLTHMKEIHSLAMKKLELEIEILKKQNKVI